MQSGMINFTHDEGTRVHVGEGLSLLRQVSVELTPGQGQWWVYTVTREQYTYAPRLSGACQYSTGWIACSNFNIHWSKLGILSYRSADLCFSYGAWDPPIVSPTPGPSSSTNVS